MWSGDTHICCNMNITACQTSASPSDHYSICVRNYNYWLVTSWFEKESVFGLKNKSQFIQLIFIHREDNELRGDGKPTNTPHTEHNTDLDPADLKQEAAWEIFVLIRPNKPALKTLDAFFCCWGQKHAADRTLRASNQPSNLSFS